MRGEHPGIGYSISGWENLASGSHTLTSMLIDAPENYDADVLLKEYRAPPSVTIGQSALDSFRSLLNKTNRLRDSVFPDLTGAVAHPLPPERGKEQTTPAE